MEIWVIVVVSLATGIASLMMTNKIAEAFKAFAIAGILTTIGKCFIDASGDSSYTALPLVALSVIIALVPGVFNSRRRYI